MPLQLTVTRPVREYTQRGSRQQLNAGRYAAEIVEALR